MILKCWIVQRMYEFSTKVNVFSLHKLYFLIKYQNVNLKIYSNVCQYKIDQR